MLGVNVKVQHVYCQIEINNVKIWLKVMRKPSEDECEELDIIGTEITADYGEETVVVCKYFWDTDSATALEAALAQLSLRLPNV